MKWSFRTTKILFACLMACYFLPSCRNKQVKTTVANYKRRPSLPNNGKILIIGIASDNSLILADAYGNDATDVVCERGQTIKWKVDCSDDIHITDIAADNIWEGNDPNFFHAKPSKDNDQNWHATVRDESNKHGSIVGYWIKWYLGSDPKTVYTYDPLMQLNPIK